MSSTMFNQDKEEMQPTGKGTSKKSSNSIYLASPKRRRFTYFQKVSSLSDIERLYYNISLITNKFLQDYHNQVRVSEFKSKYKTQLQIRYMDIILIIKEFKEFNIFDYIQVPDKGKSTKEIKEIRKLQQIKNNILLAILTVAKGASLLEKQISINEPDNSNQLSNERLFADLSFLNPIADELSTLTIDANTNYDFEIEVFFLSILNYKDKARMIKQKQNNYFRTFISDLNLPDKYTIDDLISTTICKDNYAEFTDSEMIVLRKIFSNAARRKFYCGFELLLKFPPYNIVMSEGRIWKDLGLNLPDYQVYSLWMLYEIEIEQVRNTELKLTLAIEYNPKLLHINQTMTQLNKRNDKGLHNKSKLDYKRKELEKEIALYSVTCLKELLVIFFQYDLKELIMYIFDQYKIKKIPIEIYELCLDYDEDISIDIMDRALSQGTAKEIYMKIALIKKYLRLANCLLKFAVCKNYLNSPPPRNENYVFLIHKEQIKKRNEEFFRIVFNKEVKNDGDKLITFLQEENNNSSLQSLCQNNSGSFQELMNYSVHNSNSNINTISNNNTSTKINNANTITNMNNSNVNASPNNNNNNSNSNVNIIAGTQASNKNVITLKENRPNNIIVPSPEDNEGGDDTIVKENLLRSIEFLSQQKKKKNYASDFDKGYSVIMKESSSFAQDIIDKDIQHLSPMKKHSRESIIAKQMNMNSNDKEKAKTTLHFYKNEEQQNVLQLMDSKDPSSLQSVYKSKVNKTKTIEEIKLHQMKQLNLPPLNVQSILIDELRYGQNAFDALCLLLSINDAYINLDYAEKTCKNLIVFTANEDAISKCSYPLITIALAAEYLNKIGSLSQKIQYKTISIVEELLKLGESIQSSMKDEDMLNYFLKGQTDHIGRNALEIYAENDFSLLLNDISVGDIVGKMWYGSGYELSLFRYFRLTRILTANIVYESYVSVVSSNYLPKDSIYTFQFNHYIKNCSMRFSVGSFMIIVSAVLYQVIIFFYVEGSRTMNDPMLTQEFKKLSITVDTMAILNVLNSLLCFIYYYKTGRRPRVQMLKLGTDVIFFIAILINLFNVPEIICSYDKDQELNLLLNGIMYSVIIITSWMRVIAVLLKTFAYGSFFRIMFQIFWHVFVFLLITFCLNFLFAQVLTLFFKNSNHDFYEIYYGFITLFNTAFGKIEFENFTQLTIYGYICIIGYTTVSNIMLFNLIVGIIDNLFDELQEKADAENRSLLILAYERIKWDDRFGLLILLPSPFNAFSLLFIIILLIASEINEDSVKQLNLIFSKICYFFIAITYFIALITIGVICIPFAYIKSIVHSCYDSIITQDPKQIALTFFNSILFRLWDLIVFFVEDLYFFWILLYKDTPNHEDVHNQQIITKDYILALRKVLIKLKFQEKKKILSSEELYSKLGVSKKKRRTCFHFGESNHNVLYSPSNIGSKKNNETFISRTTFIDQELAKEVMKDLIDRIVDIDGLIDIERTLYVLPYRVKYNESYLNNLRHVNIRALLRGLRKYFFSNDVSNAIYSYKRMQQIVFKLLIKFNLIYNYLPKEAFENIKLNFFVLNNDSKYQKTGQALVKYEQKEDISEYDDAGDLALSPSEIGNTTDRYIS